MSQRIIFALCMLAMILGAMPALAQWSTDPTVNNPISTASGSQFEPRVASDGSGGAIITWRDTRNGGFDIYAQRIDASGAVQWTTDGVAISTANDAQNYCEITSDGAGGAIITWQDFRSGTNNDIYAQRIDANGAVQWIVDGVAISTESSFQGDARITSDGSGGAIITWRDGRSGTNDDIYAQRIDASGAVQWTTDGVAISTASGFQSLPSITSDGSGGAIITWRDGRSGTNNDIYAQRINASGAVQWTADGVAISTASGFKSNPMITSDGASGAIITWQDQRSGSGTSIDIYAQRIDAGGAVQWTTDGVAISTASGGQQKPMITSDGASGAIITWEDNRSGTQYIYTQRIDANGAVQWAADGVALTTAGDIKFCPTIIGDGAGGAIITWRDFPTGGGADIYAQRVNASGIIQWTSNGVIISSASGNQDCPIITSDGAGGAVITWADNRSGTNDDIYAQHIDANGAAQWAADGASVSTVIGAQRYPVVIYNGAGRAMITWWDYRSGTNFDIYAQLMTVVPDQPPVADAGDNQTVIVTETVQLDGSGSSDPNNDPLTYSWSFFSKPAGSNATLSDANTVNPTFVPDVAGDYVVELVVNDGSVNSAPAQVTITANSPAGVKPFVFLANKVTLKSTKQTTPAGDVHSNGLLIVEKGKPSTYNSNLTAIGKITIGKYNTINGNVKSQTSVSNSGTITGTKTIGSVNTESLPSLSYSAGGLNKTVPNGGALTLAPGSYGNVTMSQGGTLKLTSGEYFMNELRYASTIEGGTIQIDLSSGDPVTINVVNNLQLGHEAAIVLLPNGENDSHLVTFNTMQSTNANWGREAYMLGSFNAPNALVTLVKNSQLRGTICAKEILVSNDCLFLHHDSPGTLPGPGNLPKTPGELYEEDGDQSPVANYQLEQNFPNPFNPETTIHFALPEAGSATLTIYNLNGQVVKRLVDSEMSAGRYGIVWNGRNEHGEAVASGIYVYVLKAGEFTAQRKLVLMK